MRFGLSLTSGALFMAVFSIGLPIVVLAGTLVSVRTIPRAQRRAVSAIVICVTMLVAGMGVFLLAGELRTSVVIGERMLVQVPPFQSLSVGRSDVVRAYRVSDRTQDPGLRLAVRTNGTAVGSYLTGAFRLADGRSAVLMASGPACVVVELKDKVLILAPNDLEGFVRALQAWGVTVAQDGRSGS
jgi:hypothetical protein